MYLRVYERWGDASDVILSYYRSCSLDIMLGYTRYRFYFICFINVKVFAKSRLCHFFRHPCPHELSVVRSAWELAFC